MKKFFGNPIAIALFVLPTLLLFSVMVFYPITQVFYRSLYDWNGLSAGTFVGMENYLRLFDDKGFQVGNMNGFRFAAVITVFQMVMATVLALSLSSMRIKGKSILRVAYFIPVVLSVTVVCQLWLSIYNADTGLLNRAFEYLGINFKQNWLAEIGRAHV